MLLLGANDGEVDGALMRRGNSPYAMAGDAMMALTKDIKDTIQARAQRGPAFRKALLQGKRFD